MMDIDVVGKSDSNVTSTENSGDSDDRGNLFVKGKFGTTLYKPDTKCEHGKRAEGVVIVNGERVPICTMKRKELEGEVEMDPYTESFEEAYEYRRWDEE